MDGPKILYTTIKMVEKAFCYEFWSTGFARCNGKHSGIFIETRASYVPYNRADGISLSPISQASTQRIASPPVVNVAFDQYL